MNIVEAIQNRRTIKPMYFTEEKINENIIHEMLAAANWAPTHKMTEPWRFVVFAENAKNQFGIDHANMYKAIKTGEEFDEDIFQRLQNIAKKSSFVIAIILKRDEDERVKEIEEIAAVSCAVQNMMLVATANDVAHIWSTSGLTYHSKMKEYLGFSVKDTVMGFLYLGKTDLKPKAKRFSSAEEKTLWKRE